MVELAGQVLYTAGQMGPGALGMLASEEWGSRQ